MTIKIVILSFVFLPSVFAQESAVIQYKIGNDIVSIYNYEDSRIMTSEKCDSLKDQKLCPSIKFLEDITLKKAGIKGIGDITAGPTICKKLLKGTVFIAINVKNKNENSFCKLKNLYIDHGTLVYYSAKNQSDVKNYKRNED